MGFGFSFEGGDHGIIIPVFTGAGNLYSAAMTQSANSPSSQAKTVTEIRGHRIPKRRFTRWALYYFMLYVVLPVLAISLLADALLYFFLTRFTDHCYALFCLFN